MLASLCWSGGRHDANVFEHPSARICTALSHLHCGASFEHPVVVVGLADGVTNGDTDSGSFTLSFAEERLLHLCVHEHAGATCFR